MLKQTSSQLCAVIYLKEEDNILYDRLINRRVCPKCNQSFNNTIELCPDCNTQVVKRDDDELLIIDTKIKNQKQALQEVVDYYKKTNKLLELNSINLENIDVEMQKIEII